MSKVKAEKFVVLSNGGVKAACGKIRVKEPRKANAFLFGKGSAHKLTLVQESPFDETQVELDLTEAQVVCLLKFMHWLLSSFFN